MSYLKKHGLLFIAVYSLFLNTAFSQSSDCIDLGTGIGISNDEIALIDFFKNGGTWEVVGDNGHPWYKVNRLDSFKVVNGAYYNWDIDWSGTVNNEAWGADWADCFISFWDMMVDQGKIRADGYPTEFPTTVYKYRPKSIDPNQSPNPASPVQITQFSRRIYFPPGLPTDGWVMKWKGKGRISYEGIEVTSSSVPREDNGLSWKPDASAPYAGRNYTFDSRSSSNGGRVVCRKFWMVHGYVLNILSSDPLDPIRDIVLLYPGLEAQYDAGQKFNPLFLERMRQFRSLRYMGYLNSNGIESRRVMAEGHPFENTYMLDRLRWNERTPENYYVINNGNGGNYETIIDLANQTGTDPWVNIPYCAGKPYVDSLVSLFMERLSPDLTLYLEVGNEMWNFAQGFDGFFWQARLRVREYPGLGDVEARGVFINEMFEQVTQTAGPRNLPRIVRVFGAFPRYYDVNNRTLSMVNRNYWDALASTWYFSLSEDNSSSNSCRDPQTNTNWRSVLYNWFIAHPNDQAGFNSKYRDCLLNEFRCEGGYRNNVDVQLANYYNKKIVCYEGGNHTLYGCENGPTGDALPGELDFNTPTYPNYYSDNAFINAICAANESDQIGEVFDEVLDSLQSAGFILANHLSFAGRSTCYGVWDLIQDRDITAPLATLLARYPKYRVFANRINSDNCRQQNIVLEGDTVGPGLSIMTDGVDDYIEGETTYIPDETANYTLEAWFKPDLPDYEQVILSFSSNGTNDNYNVFKVRADNHLVWEIGNNSTVNAKLIGPSIEPDLWNHVAVVKNGNRYSMYLNGVNVASNNYNLSQSTRNHFTMGALYKGSSATAFFDGEIDEVRLWNTARTIDEIREYMCKKVPRNYAQFNALRAYYKFDYPDYENSGLFDYVTRTINGHLRNINITERSRYAVSGAPIGDYSRNIYPASWNGVSISITHTQGDRLAAYNLSNGSPSGIHVYMADGRSHYNDVPQYYEDISDNRVMGVFIANGTETNYDVTYVYSGNSDVNTSGGEEDLRLLRRNDASIENWLHAGAVTDPAETALTITCKERYRGEYNIGHRRTINQVRPGSGRAILDNQTPTGNVMGLVQYLDMKDFTATFWAKGWGEVFRLTSKLNANSCNFTLGADNNNTNCGVRYGRHWDYDVTFNVSGNVGSVNDWHHYAITKNGSNIKIYVDGIERRTGNVTVEFPLQELYLCNAPSWQAGNFPGRRANLSLDEFTLWNTALDQQTIREWMCKKINKDHPLQCENLVVYFNFDEGQGNVLEDRRGPSDVVFSTDAQGFQWIVSGAAIGDESLSDYESPESITFAHPDGDYLEATRTSGSSNGVHLYRVDNMPPEPSTTNSASINSVDSSRYWGLFVVKPATGTTYYSVVNHYQLNSQVNLARESELRMPSRLNNSVSPWTGNNTILPNTTQHSLTLTNQQRGEYILAGTSEETFNDYLPPATPVFLPEEDSLNLSSICGNSTGLVYQVQHDPYATSYVWTLPQGLEGFSTADSIIINSTYTGASATDVTITVRAINNYGESAQATYNIHIVPRPTVADAGPDQIILPPLNSATMDGNNPQVSEIATWICALGTGNITDIHNPKTTVTALLSGNNRFAWDIDNSICPVSSDTVNLLVAPPPTGIIQQNGDPLPAIVCQGDILFIRVIPPEDITPNSYVWELPNGIILISQNGTDANIQVNNGIGGSIGVRAVYSGQNSEPYYSEPISINSLPNRPVFNEEPSVLCLNVNTTVSINYDATVDSVAWVLPYGIYPTVYPKSTSESIEIEALDVTSGYIKAYVYNDGCASSSSVDSFQVSVSEAPEKPELYLGTDGGTADAVCANNDFLLWVRNNDNSAMYEWEWNADVTFISYFNDNHSGALFHLGNENSDVRVRTVKGNGACSTSEWFEFYAWAREFGPASITNITITNPAGQNAMALVVGQTYTFRVTGNAENYYWDVPEGFELIDDGNSNDAENRIRVVTAGAGHLDVYPITQRGCSGDAFRLNIGTAGSLLPPDYVSGPTTFCQDTVPNITVANISGATQYIWTLPNGISIITATNVLNQPVNAPMEGVMTVVARNNNTQSAAVEIRIKVSPTFLSHTQFVDEENNPITELEICDGDYYKPVYIKSNFAQRHIWDIRGSAIQFEPRWESGHDGEANYELRNRTSVVDTMMPVSWVNWRCLNNGADGGYIIVTSVNGCGGPNIKDSIPYVWHQTLSELIPEFTQAPQEVCVGSTVNYEIKPIPNATQYIWQLPNGLVTSDIVTTSPSITVDIVNGTGGPVGVMARGEYCGSSQTAQQLSENIRISGEAVDFHFIDQTLAACPGDPLTYSVNDIGATTYNWSLPEALRSTIKDDDDATGILIYGNWSRNTRPNMINGEYRSISNNNSANNIRYTPNLPYTGRYRVSISYFSSWDGRQDVPVVIFTPNGSIVHYVNMNAPPENGIWHVLGEYNFNQGTSGYVTIGSQPSGGSMTFSDAVRFEILSIPDDTTITIPATLGQGGAVCISAQIPQCATVYTICTDPVNVSSTLEAPVFSLQENSVCAGMTYTYRASDIGADTYTWILPSGMNIGGRTGTITGLGRQVTVNMVTNTGSPVKIGVFGVINSCNIYSDTIYTNNILYNGLGCKLTNPVFTAEPISVCTGSTATFTVTAVQFADEYHWTVPPGLRQVTTLATGNIITTNPSITVEPTGTPTGNLGRITVSAYSSTIPASDIVQTTSIISAISAPTFNLAANNITQCNLNNGTINISGLSNNTSYTVTYQAGTNTVGPNTYNSNASGTIALSNLSAGSYNNFRVDRNGCASNNNNTLTISSPVIPVINDITYNSPVICGGSGTVLISLTGSANGDTYYVDYNNDGTINDTGIVASNLITLSNVPTITVFSAMAIRNSLSNCIVTSNDTGRIADPQPVSIRSIRFVNPSTCGGTGSIRMALTGAIAGQIYDIDFHNNGTIDASATVTGDSLIVASIAAGTAVTDLFLTNRASTCRIDNGSVWTFADPAPAIISGINIVNPTRCGENGSVQIALNGAPDNSQFAVDLNNDNIIDVTLPVINDTIKVTNRPVGTNIYQVSVRSVQTNCLSVSNYSGSILPPLTPIIRDIELFDPETCGGSGSMNIYITSATNGEQFSIDFDDNNTPDATAAALNDTIRINNIPVSQTIHNLSITSNRSLCESVSDLDTNFHDPSNTAITGLTISNVTRCGETGSILINLTNASQGDGFSIDYNNDGIIDNTGTVNNNSILLPGIYAGTRISNLAITNNISHCETTGRSIDTGTVAGPNLPVINMVSLVSPVTCNSSGILIIELSGSSENTAYDIGFDMTQPYETTGAAAGNRIVLEGIPVNTRFNNITIRNQNTLCTADYYFQDTVSGPTPLIPGNINFINPKYCDSTGSILISANNGIEGEIYNIDFNSDGSIDQTGIIRNDTLRISHIPAGSVINGITITQPVSQCTSITNTSGNIIGIEPPTISEIILESPLVCGIDGKIKIAVQGGTENETYNLNIDADPETDYTGHYHQDSIFFDHVRPGTNITTLTLISTSTLCRIDSQFIGEIANPSPYSINSFEGIDPLQCNVNGSLQISVNGASEGQSFRIDLNNDNTIEDTCTLHSGTLEVSDVPGGTIVNGLAIINMDNSCPAETEEIDSVVNPPLPDVSLNLPSPYCIGTQITPEGGSPEGGRYLIDNTDYAIFNTTELGSGSYQVTYTYTDANNCTNSATDTLIINKLPDQPINGATSICPNSSEIVYQTNSNPNNQYTWQVINGTYKNGSGNNEIIVDWLQADQGSIILHTMDVLTECADTSILNILLTDHEAPEIIECPDEYPVAAQIIDESTVYTLEESDTILIPKAIDNCQSGLTYTFSLDDSVQTSSAQLVGHTLISDNSNTLTWTITDASENISTCNTQLIFELRKIAPSAFSPDGVPPNDTWEIDFLINYPECFVSVYNRWGMKVYESEKGYPEPWDGKSGGKLVPVDSYYFIIDLGDGSKPYKGYVSVIY